MSKMIKNGMISTLPPVKKGNTGEDANRTFYWTDSPQSNIIVSYFNINKIDGITSDVSIGNIYGSSVVPKVNDQIIYSENKKSRTFNITNVSANNVEVETIGEWNYVEEEQESSNIDYDLNIMFTFDDFYEYKEPAKQGENSLYENRQLTTSKRSLMNVLVTSNNNKPLGKIKVTLEFVNNTSSPAMDTMLPHWFDNYNKTFTFFSGYGTEYTKTYRGSIDAYNRLSKTYKLWYLYNKAYYRPRMYLNHYDDEKLDNFMFVVKDFNEDYNNTTHISQYIISKNISEYGLTYLAQYSPISHLGEDYYIFTFYNYRIGNVEFDATYYLGDVDDGDWLGFDKHADYEFKVDNIYLNSGGYGFIVFKLIYMRSGFTYTNFDDPGKLNKMTVFFHNWTIENTLCDYTLYFDTGTRAEGEVVKSPYKCFAYVYVPNTVKDYNKICLGEIDFNSNSVTT